MAVKLNELYLTGKLTLPVGADAYTNASLFFGSKSKIGTSTNDVFGIYTAGKMVLRPNSGTLGYSEGLELSPAALIPTKNNTVTLGDSTHKWKNVYATTFTGALSGNAATATILGKSSLTADTIDTVTHNGLLYGTISSYTEAGFGSNDAMVLSMAWNTGNSYGAQIALDDTTTPNMYVRNKASSWSSWSKVLLSTNYTDYTVQKDGTGASGDSWAIGITGNANTATTASKTQAALSLNGKSFNGSSAVNMGTLGVAYGGTGLTALVTPTVTWANGTSSGPTLVIKDSLGKSSTAQAIPKATSTQSGIVTTDDQTFSGIKRFTSAPIFTNGKYYSSFYLKPQLVSAGEDRLATIYCYGATSSTDTVLTTSQVRIRQYSYTANSTTALQYYDQFSLPVTAAGKTANNNYTILTTKNVVTVAQGGTNANSAAGARANLGTMAAISANGYYGMGLPDGTTSTWIRTTSSGIIPYQSGGASALGTSGWPFTNAYINTVYGNLSGNASSATLLSIHNTITSTTTRSVSASSWTGAISGVNYMWGQAFKDTAIGTDTGDIVFAVRAGQYTSGGTELCVAIDGDYYSMGNKVLHAGNYNSYALPLSGGTLTGDVRWRDGTNGTNYITSSINAVGTTTETGIGRLTLGNATAAGTAGNARGRLSIYGDGISCIHLQAHGMAASRYYNFQDHGKNVYAVGVPSAQSAVGSSTEPVYVNNRGIITACGASLAANAATASRLASFNSFPSASGVQYCSGSITKGTSPGQAFEGTSPGWAIWSYPAGGTWTNDTVANVQTLRLFWGDSYFTDIFTSPNTPKLWTRAVQNGAAGDWRQIVDTSGNCTFTGSLSIAHATNAVMDASTTNPRITFSENGSQPVSLVYTDYNNYRAPAGLKVVGTGADASPAWFEAEGDIYGAKVHGAVWNDYAEYRRAETIEPGRVVQESKDGIMKITTERMVGGCEIISDTFGFAIGETDECKTPIAATGRVLAYPYEDRNTFELGQAVCAGPGGTVSRMSRNEIIHFPDRIIGTVSEIPDYETWGTGNVKVNGRIWIRIR